MRYQPRVTVSCENPRGQFLMILLFILLLFKLKSALMFKSDSEVDLTTIIETSSTKPAVGGKLPVEFHNRSHHLLDYLRKKKHVKTAHHEDHHIDYHSVPLKELLQRLHSNQTTGISDAAASALLAEGGPNVISPPKKSTQVKNIDIHIHQDTFLSLLKYLVSGFGVILWPASVLCFLSWKPLGEPTPDPTNVGLAVVIWIVVLLSAAFNAYQEWSSSKVMASIFKMLPATALGKKNFIAR